MQQPSISLHNHNSTNPSFTHSGENNITKKKKKKVKLELAALVAKDIEELNRKRAVKQEPVDELDSLSRCSGALASSSLSYGEDSIDTSPVPMVEIATEHSDNPLPEAGHSGMSDVRFLCLILTGTLFLTFIIISLEIADIVPWT
jgi:hypothetical protein